MVVSMLSGMSALLAQAPTTQEVADKLTLDSQILSEQFYYFTVCIMWLIHVGFMSYEAGAGRRKNVMATAMKNILTIAVVTPTFYYFGWWIYGCFSTGIIPFSPGDFLDSAGQALPGTSSSEALMANFCSTTYPWAANFGPEPDRPPLGRLLGRVPPLLVDDRFDPLGRAHRARAALGLPDPRLHPRLGHLDPRRLVGLERRTASCRCATDSTTRSPGLVVHGVAGAFTLGVLLNLGPRIGKYTRDGLARTFRPHNLHITLMGLMLIFTGFYGFYAACLVIQSTALPGWGNIYFNPTTLSAITFAITIGFAGGFTGGYFASRGDPFWTLSGGLAGVISVSAGADIYAPSLDYLISMFGGALAVYAGNFIEKRLRIDDAVGAVAVHGVCGFWSPLAVGLFAAGYPTGLNNIDSSLDWPALRDDGLPPARVLRRLHPLVGPQEAEPPARAARGRARRPRPGRVPGRLLSGVRAPPEVIIEPDGSGGPLRADPARGLP